MQQRPHDWRTSNRSDDGGHARDHHRVCPAGKRCRGLACAASCAQPHPGSSQYVSLLEEFTVIPGYVLMIVAVTKVLR